MLALGLIMGDRAALLLGEIVTVLASAMVAMSIFVKLTRRHPVEVLPPQPWWGRAAPYIGMVGVTGLPYSGLSYRLNGGQGFAFAALRDLWLPRRGHLP